MADEERIRQLELHVARLQEQLSASREALRLQASEYERRLDVLNHAHEEARQVLNTYVPREAFESYVKETAMNLERVRDELAKTKSELLPSELYNQKHDALVNRVNDLHEAARTFLSRDTFAQYDKEQRGRMEAREKEEQTRAEAVKEAVAQTRDQLEGAVKELAVSVERTRVETTRRLEVQIEELKSAQVRREGQSSGVSTVGKVTVGAVAAMGTIITLVVLVANHAI